MAYVNLGQIMYPIGTVYQSWSNTSPATLFGGSWVQIVEKFLYCANSAGESGGTGEVTLTIQQIPAHNHSGSTASAGSHYHNNGLDMDVAGGSYRYGPHLAGESGAQRTYPTGWAGSHSHSVSINKTGGGAAHTNMPPYIKCYAWRRTA